MLHALHAEILVQVQRDLAVRTSTESMAALLQIAPLPFEVIKLTVDDDMNAFVLVRDRLIPGCEVNNAQPRVTETDALIGRKPYALIIWTAMMEGFRGTIQRLG